MEKLIKVTDKRKTLKGIQKTAILLGELGPENSKAILECLNLSTKEYKKITKELKKLNKYSVNNVQIKANEIAVLNEVVKYGKAKGIINPVEKDHTIGLKNLANNNPSELAKILSSWLGDK